MLSRNKILAVILAFILLSVGIILYFTWHDGTKADTYPDTEIEGNDNISLDNDIISLNDEAKNNSNTTIPVLMYHSIRYEEGNPVRMAKERFEEQMKWLNDNGYTSLTMNELFEHITYKIAFPKKAVVITLDDGYRDNYTNAFPILKKYGMNATIFMLTAAIGSNDYLTEDQIKEMSASGIDIQDHTVNHHNLDELSYEEQYIELKDSKEKLEKLTGKNIEYFSFPTGRYNSNTISILKDLGYKMSFRMDGGLANLSDNIYEVRRIYVGGFDSLDTFVGKAKLHPDED